MGLLGRLKAAKTWQDYTATHVKEFGALLEPGEQARYAAVGSEGALGSMRAGRQDASDRLIGAVADALNSRANLSGDEGSIARSIPLIVDTVYLVVTDRRFCVITTGGMTGEEPKIIGSVPKASVTSFEASRSTKGGAKLTANFADDSTMGFVVSFEEDVDAMNRALAG